jgi:hypothetical protein
MALTNTDQHVAGLRHVWHDERRQRAPGTCIMRERGRRTAAAQSCATRLRVAEAADSHAVIIHVRYEGGGP